MKLSRLIYYVVFKNCLQYLNILSMYHLRFILFWGFFFFGFYYGGGVTIKNGSNQLFMLSMYDLPLICQFQKLGQIVIRPLRQRK